LILAGRMIESAARHGEIACATIGRWPIRRMRGAMALAEFIGDGVLIGERRPREPAPTLPPPPIPARSWACRGLFCVGAILDHFWTQCTFGLSGSRQPFDFIGAKLVASNYVVAMNGRNDWHDVE
jgi:hypothetical protein